jgi:peptidyl-prolyl cis-trans isomerase B (cyclophilin B)
MRAAARSRSVPRGALRAGAVVGAVAGVLAALAACAKPETPPDDGWKAEPSPEARDFRLVVTAAAPKVTLGDDLVFRVRVENSGPVRTKLNVPRLGRDSVSFKVRGAPFDVAWLDPRPVKETPRGAMPNPPEVKEAGQGEYVEGEIRVTAALCGSFSFSPVYTCQALGGPLSAEPVKVEVVPSPEGSVLGARLDTTHGAIDVKLRADIAFQTVTAFATLVKKGFFDGLKFHRVVAGFMAQGGDPMGQGYGGPGYMLRRELHGKLPHKRGVFSMARQQDPDTAGSQFFILFRDAPELDKLGYTTFGEMVGGADVLKKIESLGSNAPDGSDQSPREPVQIKKASLLVLK